MLLSPKLTLAAEVFDFIFKAEHSNAIYNIYLQQSMKIWGYR